MVKVCALSEEETAERPQGLIETKITSAFWFGFGSVGEKEALSAHFKFFVRPTKQFPPSIYTTQLRMYIDST